MTELSNNQLKIPSKLKSLLSDSLHPIKCSYFYCEDDTFNFECKISESEKFLENKVYSLYEIAPLLRLLTSKAEILPHEVLTDVFSDNESEICYIMNWSNVKEFLVFDVEEVDYLEDFALTKILKKHKDEILSYFRQ